MGFYLQLEPFGSSDSPKCDDHIKGAGVPIEGGDCATYCRGPATGLLTHFSTQLRGRRGGVGGRICT